ncbi:MAG: hypothetical protein F4X44_00715 [Gammaproteobacteria bacterium]|nr:hypothetical protein [Gammaproteobacteria bacterium]MYD79125.1 hypothetical protein [Gammaproteobacteria bacterium]
MKKSNLRSSSSYVWKIGFLSACLLMFCSTATLPQESESSITYGGPVPIKVIGDRILARVELQTEVWFKDTYVVLDYEMPYAFALNFPVIRDLRFGEGENSLKVLNEGFRMEIPRSGIVDERRLGDPQMSAELSGRYDKELDQVDIVGIVGWPVLKSYGFTLDIQDESMVFHPDGELSMDEVRASSEMFVAGVETIGDSVFIPVNYDGGQRAFMKLSTNSYHTVLNREILDDRESGVVDEVHFGSDQSMKLSDMAALYPQDLYMKLWDKYAADKKIEEEVRAWMQERGEIFPEEYAVKRPDQPSSDILLVSGLSVLSGYRIVLDHRQGFLGLTRTVNSNYTDADHQFYMATSADDEEKLFTFLEENREDRNVEEAVADLIDLGIESGATVERQLEALQFGLDTSSDRRRFKYVADFVFQLYETPESRDKNSDLIVSFGEKALEDVATSDQPRLRQHVQLMVGDRYFARNDVEKAWQHFLNAAFNGDPDLESFVRYNLGRAYEAMGKESRAYVNYAKALEEGLPPDETEKASEALERLRLRIDPDDPALEATTSKVDS